MDKSARQVWGGVDWGQRKHVAQVVDAQGQASAVLEVEHSVAGLQQLVAWFVAQGPVAGIAVETCRHQVVQALREAGFAVYPVNPKLSHAWRKGWAVSEAKDDRRDALVLADGLQQHHARLSVYTPDVASARELKRLCDDERKLIQQQTALVQQLQDAVRQYYPAALAWFSDLTTQCAWDFLLMFPTPTALAQASKAKLNGFLRCHKIALGPQWQERVAQRGDATQWPSDAATEEVQGLWAQAQAKQLRTLHAVLHTYRQRIEAGFAAQPDHALFQSLPGAGPKLAPRLHAAFGTQREQYASAQSVQQLSGTAPVTTRSGAHETVHMRRACRKDWRCTMHQFAWQSTRYCAWARACYDLARARGQSAALALRNLANKWLKIIYRMWQTGKPYDEAKFVAQLVKTRSPIAYHMGLLKTGG